MDPKGMKAPAKAGAAAAEGVAAVAIADYIDRETKVFVAKGAELTLTPERFGELKAKRKVDAA